MNCGGYTRRRILLGGSTTVLVGLAGCSSNGDDDDGTATAASDPDADAGSDAWDIETPDDPAFLANPEVVGPGEDAKFVLTTWVTRSIDDYDRFESTFETVSLHRDGDDDVTVPIDVTVDLTAYEPGSTGELITLVWVVGIPTGTYTSLTLDVTPVEIVHEFDGDVTDGFEDPPVFEFAADDGVEIFEDGAIDTRMTLAPEYDFETPTLEEPLSVNTTAGETVVLDPTRYEN